MSVHQAERCNNEDAKQMLGCLVAFREKIVKEISYKMGFSLDRTGKWALIEWGDPRKLDKDSGSTSYTASSPF